MDYKKEIGRRIKAAREDRRLTLEELSRLTQGQLSKTRIQNYEAGERTPGPREIVVLAEALEESAPYLMGLDGEDSMTRQEARLLRNWRALPESQREEYARHIEALAMAYRAPVPDERMGNQWKAPAHEPLTQGKPKKRS